MLGQDKGTKLCNSLSQEANGVETLEPESGAVETCCSSSHEVLVVLEEFAPKTLLRHCLPINYDFAHKIQNDGFRAHLTSKILKFDLVLRALKARAKKNPPTCATTSQAITCLQKGTTLDALNLHAENIFGFRMTS